MALKPRNVVAIALGIAGGMIFGGMSGAAKVVQDDCYDDIKDHLKSWWMKSKKAEKEESEDDEA